MSEAEPGWHASAVLGPDALSQGSGAAWLYHVLGTLSDLLGAWAADRYGSWRRLRIRYDSNLKQSIRGHPTRRYVLTGEFNDAHARASSSLLDGW